MSIEASAAGKIASAITVVENTGKTVSIGGGLGVAAADLAGWITAHAVLVGLAIALIGYITSSLLSYWFKLRLLAIAEKHGVNVVTGDE